MVKTIIKKPLATKFKFWRIFAVLLIPLLAKTQPIIAQNVSEYLSEAGSHAVLYRGKMQNLYPFKYNGTYFLQTRTFGKGSVRFNGKIYHGVLLNLDAYSMELVVKPSESAGGLILQRDQVSEFTMGSRRFINLEYLGYDARPGFYELLKDGAEPVFRYGSKQFRTEPNQKETQEMDGNFTASVPNVFVYTEAYYVLENGALKSIRKRAARKRLLDEKPAGESVLEEKLSQWHPGDEQIKGILPPAAESIGGISLPDGYFLENKIDTTTDTNVEYAMTATYRNKIYTIGEDAKRPKSGRAVIRGTVFEAESGEPLPGAVVFDELTATYARTNSRGRYQITLPCGENTINFNADSKEDLTLKIVLESDGSLDVVMTEKITLLKGAMVSASSMERHRTTSMGVESVSMKTAGKIPSAFGEGDIIRAVLTLPGVKSVGEASGGINVRGGSADQNLILFNESTIYNPNHMFGIFSSFNPDIVDQVELYKSSIPAEYGGRISSVMEVSSKDGSAEKFKGSLGVGVLTGRLHLEGPLWKGKTSFSAGARTTYSDWILRLLPKNSAYNGGSAAFSDANLGITHRFNKDNTLQAYAYYAKDRFSFSGDTTFNYKNLNASLIFRHKSDDGSALKISAGYDHFSNSLGVHNWQYGAYDLDTYIRQAFLKAIRRHTFGNHQFSYGAHAVGYGLDPGILSPYGEESEVKARRLDREYALEPSAFVSDIWQITGNVSVDGGIRFSGFVAENKFYGGPEWRLSAKYSPAENMSFKAGINTMRQYIHLISNTSSISPMDTWKLSDANIRPTTGWQAAGGAYWTHLGTGLDFSLEGYWKQMKNCLDYKSGAVLSMNPNLSDDLVPVYGKAWGVEAMVKRTVGTVTGWVSYSYSRSFLKEMEDRGNETINLGDWYNAPYDKPHEFKLALNWAITHRYSFSANVDYSTGRPVTVPIGLYYYGGKYRLAYSERNTYRIPDYFRTDLAFNIDPGHYLKAIAHTSITIGVYNVTGRKNPYSVFFRSTPSGRVQGYMLSVFATQIPYLNVNILF